MSKVEDIEYFNAACTRLIYDFVTADGYISPREMNLLEKYSSTYKCNDKHTLLRSRYFSFSGALSYVASSGRGKEVLKVLVDITGTKKTLSWLSAKCSAREARMLLAAKYILGPDTEDAKKVDSANSEKEDFKVRLFSLNKSLRISKKEIIYLEGGKTTANNTQDVVIYKRFSSYHDRLALHGLDLCSVKHLVETLYHLYEKQTTGDVDTTSDDYIEKLPLNALLGFLYPNKTNTKLTTSIIKKLPGVSTREFTSDLLGDVPDVLENAGPSFLIKITDSKVSGVNNKVMDFLLIPIEGRDDNRIDKTINKIVEDFAELSSEPFSDFKYNSKGLFNVRGWDKTFLDYVISKRSDPLTISRIEIGLYDKQENKGKQGKHWNVRFIGGDNYEVKALQLSPQCLALYILVVYMSSIGKSVFNKDITADTALNIGHVKEYEESKRIFRLIYKKVNVSKNESCDSSFNSMYSKFKKLDEYVGLPGKLRFRVEKYKGTKLKYESWYMPKHDLCDFVICGNGIKAVNFEDFFKEILQ